MLYTQKDIFAPSPQEPIFWPARDYFTSWERIHALDKDCQYMA